jgi:hypothetical protein
MNIKFSIDVFEENRYEPDAVELTFEVMKNSTRITLDGVSYSMNESDLSALISAIRAAKYEASTG